MTRSLAVCVATCRRPASLERLLQSLSECDIPASCVLEVRVTDNDPAASARATVERASALFPRAIRYDVEPRPGVVHVRNHLIEIGPADLVAFIDDDEWPAREWLTELLRVHDATNADVVIGPVWADLPADAPRWLRDGRFLDSHCNADCERSSWVLGGTGNVLYSGRLFYERNFRFDSAFNATGAEDAELAARLEIAGARTFSAPGARVWEHVPRHRQRFGWLWRRKIRNGSSLDRILATMPNPPRGVRWFLGVSWHFRSGVWKLLLGLPRAVCGEVAGPVAGLFEIAVGLGRIRARLLPRRAASESAYDGSWVA